MLLHWIRKAAIESKYKTEAHHHTVGGLLMRDSQPAKHTHKCHRFCSLILVSVELHLSQIVMERTILCHFRMAIYGFDRKECNASVTIVMPLYVFLCSSLLDCLVMVLLILIAVQTVAIDGQTLFTATCYIHINSRLLPRQWVLLCGVRHPSGEWWITSATSQYCVNLNCDLQTNLGGNCQINI